MGTLSGVLLVIHGVAGGWDELAIAAVALVVLWVTLKVAGRRPADADDEDDEHNQDHERATDAQPGGGADQPASPSSRPVGPRG